MRNASLAAMTVAAIAAVSAPAVGAAQRAAPPTIANVTATDAGGGSRVLTATTLGRPLAALYLCDLDAVVCARATRLAPGLWTATLTGNAGGHRLGAVGRAGRAGYVWASFTS